MPIYRVSDKLPKNGTTIDAIFNPSYCLRWSKEDLTSMTRDCWMRSLELAEHYNAALIISSNAYYTSDIEARRKSGMLEKYFKNMLPPIVEYIKNIQNTPEEIDRVLALIQGISSILVVAEQWHMPRVLQSLSYRLPFGIDLYNTSVACNKFEKTREPSLVKSWRTSHKLSWAAWHMGIYYLLGK